MWQDYRFSVRDGTQLYGRRYAGGESVRRPVLCLASLGGNSAQFDALARALTAPGPETRDVYAIDMHGRGRSDHGTRRYDASLLTDCQDALDFMTLTGLHRVALLGSGHGGQVAALMALLRPSAVGAVILNDSGPEFEAEGVVRVTSEIASLPVPASFSDAAHLQRMMLSGTYPNLAADDWLELAQAQYPDIDGKPGRPYDPGLSRHYSLTRGNDLRVSLWRQFSALKPLPVFLLRGGLSKLLSQSTVARMGEALPGLEVMTVAHEGHTPLLRDKVTQGAIARFLARCDSQGQRSGPALKAVA